MKIDPYKFKEKYAKWKNSVIESGIPNISKYNSDLILQYLEDMEYGLNVSSVSVKGARSPIRLNTLKQKLIFFSKKFKELYGLENITDITERDLHKFFANMRDGTIQKINGGIYASAGYYTKAFKAFWHWHMKVNRKKEIKIYDITSDLDSTDTKPKWVYLDESQVKLLCDSAKYKYRVLMMFLFDSGIRSPTELVNIKVSDFYSDFKEVQIRDEVSKTFGRRIKLMLSSSLIKDYIKKGKYQEEDYIFSYNPTSMNRYIKRLSERVLGDEISPAGQRYSELTMYDFRHISCCYWMPRYKSESALKYRFGWKKSDKIHYYSELLGMRDTIIEDDMFIDTTKTELEKELTKTISEKDILKERVSVVEGQLKKILEMIEKGNLVIENY